MQHVVVIGCGIVGAAIAYELSHQPNLQVTLLDRQPPAQGATGAALGVIMGIISRKVKGRAWRLRQASMNRYETLVPELEQLTGRAIPFNRQGLVKLCFAGDDLARWEQLMYIRQSQGWRLEMWEADQVRDRCPQLGDRPLTAAIYSPDDRQVDPTALTLALVDAARQQGVQVQLDVTVQRWAASSSDLGQPTQVYTSQGNLEADWVIVAAGLGSASLAQAANSSLPLGPVLGQARRVRWPAPLGDPNFQPVITGDDIHLVPLGQGEYWLGATVEFPNPEGEVSADAGRLEQLWQEAIALWPALATAEITQQWSGRRPRPSGRPAPIIEPLPDCRHILLATGHYRNGVLLAPATAQDIQQLIATG